MVSRCQALLYLTLLASLGLPAKGLAAPLDLGSAQVPLQSLPPSRLPTPLATRVAQIHALVQTHLPVPAPDVGLPTPAPKGLTLRPGLTREWAAVLVRHGVLTGEAEAERIVLQVCGVPTTDAERGRCWLDLVVWAHDALVVGVDTGERAQTAPRHRKPRAWAGWELARMRQATKARQDRALVDVPAALSAGSQPFARVVDDWLSQLGPGRFPPYQGLLQALDRYKRLAVQPVAVLGREFPTVAPYGYLYPAQVRRHLARLTPEHREKLRQRLCLEGYCAPAPVWVRPGGAQADAPPQPRAVTGPKQGPGSGRFDLPSEKTTIRRTDEALATVPPEHRPDPELLLQLRSFQADRGLRATGLVDRTTRAELDRPLAPRVEQIRLALQRMRDAAVGQEPAVLLVNLPAFRLDLWRSGHLERSHAVQIGLAFERVKGRRVEGRRTPLLTAQVSRVVIDPAWFVPGSILPEVYQEFERDPEYMARNRFQFRTDERTGKPMLVMNAGPENLLGQVKLDFPNPHLVFAHDTTSQWRFQLPVRLTSHGCIRVHRATELARALLSADQGVPWTAEKWQALRKKHDEKPIRLKTAVPIRTVYWTAEIGPAGQVRFLPDVYALDGQDRVRLAKALDSRTPDRLADGSAR